MAGALAILVLIGISMMSKVRLSVAGNLLGSVSMALAIGITLWAFDIFSVIDLWVAMLIGALLGLVLSRKVTMLQMPQLVGLLNGFGGAASMIAGALTLLNPGGDDPFSVITSGLAIFVGSLTLTGSIVAAGKLHQVFTQKPIILTGHRFWALGSLVLGILTVPLFLLPTFQAGGAKTVLILLCVLISGAFGIFFSVRVGGADMPITISLLNSFSGVAGGIAGLAISDPLLVAVGGIVGASGLLLTQIMCRAMNRNLLDILLGKTSANVMQKADKVTADKADESTALAAETDTDLSPSPPTKGKVQSVSMSKTVVEAKTETETITAEAVRVSATVIETKQEETEGADYASWLRDAKRVIIVPGYGMALSQSQHLVKELMDKLEARGAVVDFAIHPVAGRMPGHMNVLLAEVEIPYEKLREMDDINDEFKTADIAIIIGANDVVNPAANTAENTPIYGMPILQVEDTKHLIIMNFDKKPGYAGVDNPLYEADDDQVALLLGDAKD
ncbi:MAG TPA: NAD(P)(+) transhydrogenase (Re/Si-specific) subunit beta, partial [Clostridiaceae bacterium]|nr:NAD(P)(+) transhydrogenase (Re/Si-specific) subunit beta [Clostridiaceae bacterium]